MDGRGSGGLAVRESDVVFGGSARPFAFSVPRRLFPWHPLAFGQRWFAGPSKAVPVPLPGVLPYRQDRGIKKSTASALTCWRQRLAKPWGDPSVDPDGCVERWLMGDRTDRRPMDLVRPAPRDSRRVPEHPPNHCQNAKSEAIAAPGPGSSKFAAAYSPRRGQGHPPDSHARSLPHLRPAARR